MGGQGAIDFAAIDTRQAQQAASESAFIEGADGGHGTAIF
jgi:hypothetical protein